MSECHIPRCSSEATRELHFPSLGMWRPYCPDHTPLEPHDDERLLEGGD